MTTDQAIDVVLGAVMLPAVHTSRVLFIAAGAPVWAIGLVRSAVGR